MLDYYKENIQLYLIFITWILVGMFGGPVIYVLLPLTILLMRQKEMHEEMFLGFLFILILSDSYELRLHFAKSIKNVYISLMAVILFIDSYNFQPFNKLFKFFIPFCLFSVLTLLFSVDDSFFFTSVQKTLSYILVLIVIPNFITKLYREHGTAFFRRFMLFAFTTLVVGFILKYTASSVALLETGRYRGVMGNPNGLGIYCLLIFVSFYLINDFFPELFSKREKNIVYAAILISIYMTGSRNAVLAIALFYLFSHFFKVSPFLGFFIFLILVFSIEIISNNLTTILISLGLGDFFRVKTLDEGSGRFIAWGFAWEQIQHNFFVGKGFGYNEYFMRKNYDLLSKLGHQGGIHNSFLTFWMDQGLIGLLIYLRSFILVFVKAAKKTKYAYPIFFTITFTAIFESWLVGSLSAYAFFAIVIYTLITSDEILAVQNDQKNLVLPVSS